MMRCGQPPCVPEQEGQSEQRDPEIIVPYAAFLAAGQGGGSPGIQAQFDGLGLDADNAGSIEPALMPRAYGHCVFAEHDGVGLSELGPPT